MNTPKNLDECLVELTKYSLNSSDFEEWKNLLEEQAIGAIHFGFGRRIRNIWGLWGDSDLAKYFNSLGIFHADDMSGIILTSFHRKMNNKELDVEGQIKFYQDYWKQLLPPNTKLGTNNAIH